MRSEKKAELRRARARIYTLLGDGHARSFDAIAAHLPHLLDLDVADLLLQGERDGALLASDRGPFRFYALAPAFQRVIPAPYFVPEGSPFGAFRRAQVAYLQASGWHWSERGQDFRKPGCGPSKSLQAAVAIQELLDEETFLAAGGDAHRAPQRAPLSPFKPTWPIVPIAPAKGNKRTSVHRSPTTEGAPSCTPRKPSP